MFTGIVEEMGRVLEAGDRLVIEARSVAEDSVAGSSLAVNGVCLTVVERLSAEDGTAMAFDVSDETRSRTGLGRLRPGDQVNLERPVTLVARLGGHLVQGHVDGIGEVAEVRSRPLGREVAVQLPAGLERYVVEKGSIAVDGVSLTVTGVDRRRFEVALVPFTLRATTLGLLEPGDPVNIEVDVMAKYVERLLRTGVEGRAG